MEKTRGFAICKEYEGKTRLPLHGSPESAGYDLFCPEDITVYCGQTVLVKTGIKAYMQHGEVLKIYPRSSYGIKKGMELANTVGIIDKDYYNNPDNEGNIIVGIRNAGPIPFTIKKGERFAQAIFEAFLEADKETYTQKKEERKGGIGSTGEK